MDSWLNNERNCKSRKIETKRKRAREMKIHKKSTEIQIFQCLHTNRTTLDSICVICCCCCYCGCCCYFCCCPHARIHWIKQVNKLINQFKRKKFFERREQRPKTESTESACWFMINKRAYFEKKVDVHRFIYDACKKCISIYIWRILPNQFYHLKLFIDAKRFPLYLLFCFPRAAKFIAVVVDKLNKRQNPAKAT